MKKFLVALVTFFVLASACIFAACGSSGGNGGDNGVGKKKTFCQIVSAIIAREVTTPSDAPYYFTIGDDDSYCEIDTNPLDIDDYSSSTALNYIKEMNKQLGLPDYLYNDMLHTSYSQGKQEETFDGIKVKYYYHPDKGLNVSYYRI